MWYHPGRPLVRENRNMGRSQFDYGRLRSLQDTLSKRAFVPIDAKSAQAAPPDAGGGAPPPDAGGGMPPGGDPAAMGGDPAAMGGDPSAMGGGMPPGMDPSMMGGGGMPPGGPMDPMMGMPPPDGGMGDVSPDGEPYIKVTWKQLIKMLEQLNALKSNTSEQNQQVMPAPSPNYADQQQLAAIDAKMDAIMNQLGG